MTAIEWTERVWNPVRGCSVVSEGCKNCYAMRTAARFNGPGQPYEALTVLRSGKPVWTGDARFIPAMLDRPRKRKKPTAYFVNSMSDLFHEDVRDSEIIAVFDVMRECPHHTFQILTKRPERMLEWFLWKDAGLTEWPLGNVHLGVSVENQATADARIPLLMQVPAAVRWVSAEPLLEEINLAWSMSLSGDYGAEIDWVVVGGESGPGARACRPEWIRSMVDQCADADARVFVKQFGANCPGLEFQHAKGGDPSEWPAGNWPRERPNHPA